MNQTMQAYTNENYRRILNEAGLSTIEFPSTFGIGDGVHNDMLMLIKAKKDEGV